MDSYTIFCNKLDELKKQFDNLSELKTLDLSDCELKFLPTQISDLHNLEYLDIVFNDNHGYFLSSIVFILE